MNLPSFPYSKLNSLIIKLSHQEYHSSSIYLQIKKHYIKIVDSYPESLSGGLKLASEISQEFRTILDRRFGRRKVGLICLAGQEEGKITRVLNRVWVLYR